MSKQLVSALGGALQVTEEGGNVTLEISKSASLGGGKAAGLAEVEGEAKLTIKGMTALQLGEALLNDKLPPGLVPAAVAVEGVANAALGALE